eukprot:TRINITY_DN13072_c0_g1_i1.p2 TRINITY_DN13072_c0_g1~~TRINITY_DN13072_c0_g1_i1.p2  ORF type:complete len:132 (+),score=6.37 TRINITY_DN13072_c0_g1_i1:605-1000(+)
MLVESHARRHNLGQVCYSLKSCRCRQTKFNLMEIHIPCSFSTCSTASCKCSLCVHGSQHEEQGKKRSSTSSNSSRVSTYAHIGLGLCMLFYITMGYFTPTATSVRCQQLLQYGAVAQLGLDALVEVCTSGC